VHPLPNFNNLTWSIERCGSGTEAKMEEKTMALANPGRCDKATNDANEAFALSKKLVYLTADGVRVTARDTVNRTFSFRAISATTGREQLFSNVPWGRLEDMWVCCPSSLPSSCNDPANGNNPNNPPQVGSVGSLLLDEQVAKMLDLQVHAPKWPGALGSDPPYAEAVVVPIRLILECYDRNDDVVAINLRDFRFAEQQQTITCDPNGIRVRLSQAGFGAMGENLPPTQSFQKILEDAVAELTSATPEVRLLAQALAVVGTAVEQLRDEALVKRPPFPPAMEKKLKEVQKFLPNFQI
jgi:hypothetical protein